MKSASILILILAIRVDWLTGAKSFDEYSDQELIVQYQKSHQSKWLIAFMNRHRDLIVIRTFSYLRDEDETEDFIGALFIKLSESFKKNTDIREPKAWLRRLITNTLIDQSRRQQLHKAFTQIPTSEIDNQLQETILKIDAAQLTDAIEQLHPLPKMYIIKHFFYGKQNKEIAEEMELNMNQVRGARDRALKALRESLNDDFNNYFDE